MSHHGQSMTELNSFISNGQVVVRAAAGGSHIEKQRVSSKKKIDHTSHLKSYVDNLIDNSGQIEMSDVKVKKGHSNTNVTSQGALIKKSVFMEPTKLIFTNN